MAPEKYDPNVVQALLIQVRRDVVGSNRTPLLDSMTVNIAATDIDHLAATLQHKISRAKTYLTKEIGSSGGPISRLPSGGTKRRIEDLGVDEC